MIFQQLLYKNAGIKTVIYFEKAAKNENEKKKILKKLP